MPAFLRNSLYALLLIAGIVSVFFVGRFGPLPTTVMLDGWLILFLIHSFLARRVYTWVLTPMLVLYLVFARAIPALIIDAPLEDFLQAYRWVFYLIIVTVAVGRSWGPVGPLIRVTLALIGLALTKAALTFAIIGAGERPGLLLENNFELALFAGLVVVGYAHMGRFRGWVVLAMGLLSVLAGSRSGSIAFVILAVFAISRTGKLNLFVRYVLFLMIPVAGYLALSVFESRADGRKVDRLNFFEVFQGEVAQWDIVTWVFGTTPITPLSGGACDRLSWYNRLFASTGDGSCYSVILHAFLMRVVFDAGIIGLLIAFGVLLYAMRKAHVAWSVTLALLAIAVTNSLSVSGPNNPYVLLPILLAIVTAASPVPAPLPARSRRVHRRTYGQMTHGIRRLA